MMLGAMPCRAATLVAVTAFVAIGGPGLCQDPAVDHPHQRPPADIPDAELLRRGLDLLEAGWSWEAGRWFRELVERGDEPTGYLGLALATRAAPRRAAELMAKATAARKSAGPLARRVIDAYSDCFRAATRPSAADETFDAPPDPERRAALRAALATLVEQHPAAVIPRQLLAIEQDTPPPPTEAEQAGTCLRLAHQFLRETGAMPFLIPGHASLLSAAGAGGNTALARLPRHPHHSAAAAVDATRLAAGLRSLLRDPSGGDRETPLLWQPRRAPGFDLERGLGGRGTSASLRGKPALVVFFLGFG